MVEIGGRPILWHIMKIYAAYGFKEFYIALGYKGELIKRYLPGLRQPERQPDPADCQRAGAEARLRPARTGRCT